MQIEFWGTRGSAATPDVDKLRYGGNTSSIVVTMPDMPNHFFLLDAGTGLARFGSTLDRNQAYQGTLLLSHLHLYHIIGYQFTPFAYSRNFHTRLIGPNTRNIAMESVFDHIMSPSYSPVYGLSNLVATVHFEEVDETPRQVERVTVSALPFANSEEMPSWGYRLDDGEHVLVYITDALLRQGDELTPNALRLCRGADVLIAGAFDPDHERPNLTTYADAIEVARHSGVGRVYLVHHHPESTDDDLDREQAHLNQVHADLSVIIAAEGMRVLV